MEKGEVQRIPSMQVIIAALNEEEGIGPTIAELKSIFMGLNFWWLTEIALTRRSKKPKAWAPKSVFQDGRGKGNAFAKAIEHIEKDTDYVIITDADFTYPAKYVPEMIQTLEKNPRIGMVCGDRFTEDLDHRALHDLFYLWKSVYSFHP